MGVRKEYVRSQTLSDSASAPTRKSRFRAFWWWVLIWGAALGVAASIVVRALLPEAFVAGHVVFKITCFLGASIGFAAVAYYLVVFALNRTVRDLFLACAFAALAASGGMQATSDCLSGGQYCNDRTVLISWVYAAFLFAGAGYASSAVRKGGLLTSTLQFLGAASVVGAYPAVLLFYILNGALYYRLQSFPNESLASEFDNIAAVAAALLLSVAVVRCVRSSKQRPERLDRMLLNFYVACAVGLVCRAEAVAASDLCWFCGQVLPASAWLILAAGFGAESAFTHKDLLDRLKELEALHDVSWSLVGRGGGEGFLHAFVERLRETVDAQIAAIYLSDPEGRVLELAAFSGGGEDYPRLGTSYLIASDDRRPGFHSGHTADALRSSQMRISDDVFIDVEFVPWRVIARGDGRAVSLPLMEQGVAFGVVDVYFEDRRRVALESISLLDTIVAAAGPAIGRVWAERRGQPYSREEMDRAA